MYKVATHSGKSVNSGKLREFQYIENLRETQGSLRFKISQELFSGSRMGFSKSSFTIFSKKLVLYNFK